MTTLYGVFVAVFVLFCIPTAVIFAIFSAIKETRKGAGTQQMVCGEAAQFPMYTETVQPKPKKERKKPSASAVMLLIGTIFIVLSAITFVAANWVKMEPAGRVFTLAGASVLAFAICGIMKAAAGLVRTSGAFYSIGSLVAVTAVGTAGYYELFGRWFSFDGAGMGLFSAMLMAFFAAAAFISYRIYKLKAAHYIGFTFVSAAIAYLAVQITDNFEQFAVAMSAAQMLITFVIHVIKPQKGTELEAPVRIIGDIAAILFQLTAMSYVIYSTFDVTWHTFAVLAIVICQFFAYGTFKNQRWMFIFANILAVYTDFIGASLLNEKYGDNYSILFFSFITLAIYIVNHVIPGNLRAAKVISFAGLIIGAFTSLGSTDDRLFGLNLIVPAITVLILVAYGHAKKDWMQIGSGIAMPVLPFAMALFLNEKLDSYFSDYMGNDISVLVFSGLALVYMAIAAYYIYLPKIAFDFHAHHPLRFDIVHYTTMIPAAVALFAASRYSGVFAVSIGAVILHFLLSNKLSCNLPAAGSVVCLITLSYSILAHNFADKPELLMYIMFAVFVLLMAASKLVFPDSFVVRTENTVKADVILLAAWAALIPMPFDDRTAWFLRLMSIAVYSAGFIKRSTEKDTAALILSFSAFFTAIAFITRPFLTPDSSMISSKITLAIMVLLGIAYRSIWKEHKEAAKAVSTIVFILSFIGLIVDGLVYDNVGNKIFVLVVTAFILIFSFYAKSKTWFTASSIALVVMTVQSTYKYFDAAGWWLYLLAVGLIFIAVAGVNEACKKKGETMKSTVTKKFSDWTW